MLWIYQFNHIYIYTPHINDIFILCNCSRLPRSKSKELQEQIQGVEVRHDHRNGVPSMHGLTTDATDAMRPKNGAHRNSWYSIFSMSAGFAKRKRRGRILWKFFGAKNWSNP